MRTTINVDNGLLVEAKRRAAERGTTLTGLIEDALREIPIEERGEDEVRIVRGLDDEGRMAHVNIAPKATKVANPAFDVTPARLVTGLITERGILQATRESLTVAFTERAAAAQ